MKCEIVGRMENFLRLSLRECKKFLRIRPYEGSAEIANLIAVCRSTEDGNRASELYKVEISLREQCLTPIFSPTLTLTLEIQDTTLGARDFLLKCRELERQRKFIFNSKVSTSIDVKVPAVFAVKTQAADYRVEY